MNYALFKAINDLSGDRALNSIMRFAAVDLIFVVFAALGGICVLRLSQRRTRSVVMAAATLVLTFGLGLVAAVAHPERRPFQSHRVHQLIAHAGGQSFPSDHATAAFGIALAVLVFLSRRWGVVLFAVALLIGFARVYAGVHYPGDIGASLLSSLAAVALVAASSRPPTTHSRPAQARTALTDFPS